MNLRQNDWRCSDFYNLEYALIGRPKISQTPRLRLVLLEGHLQANIMNALAGKLSENVLGGERICTYKDGACAAFPRIFATRNGCHPTSALGC